MKLGFRILLKDKSAAQIFVCHNKTLHITDDGHAEAMDEPLNRTKNHFTQFRSRIKYIIQKFFSIAFITLEKQHNDVNLIVIIMMELLFLSTIYDEVTISVAIILTL